MTHDREKKLEELFQKALDMPASERSAFLASGSGGDGDLADEVSLLIAHYEQARGGALDGPAMRLDRDGDSDAGAPVYRKIGPYTIGDELGAGGMGIVYLATQTSPVKRTVALKLLRPGIDTRSVLARFEIERELLASMDHPGIARVLDAGETDRGRPYFVMEYVRGEPVTRYCDGRSLDVRARLSLFLSVCEAVQHAHLKGVIHRDLKPSNILVTEIEGRPVPKVIDFGIAKAIAGAGAEGATLTRRGDLVGTPEYMSPEQAGAGGLDVDMRTDVYSLGVVLYRMLTGALPFDRALFRDARSEEIRRILTEENVLKPSTRTGSEEEGAPSRGMGDRRALARVLRGDLDWIVLKAVDRDRDRRYESPRALADDIRRHLEDQPVIAGPPSLGYRLRKFARRNRSALIVAGAVVFGLVAAAGGLLYALAESNRQRAIAEDAREESEAVTAFLSRTLSAASPMAEGVRVTVEEVLDDAARTMKHEFENRPLLAARLASTMGSAYAAMGEYESAETQLVEALATRERLLGPEADETVQSLFELGDLRMRQGRVAAAESLLTDVLAKRSTRFGPLHTETRAAMLRLGTLYFQMGRAEDAESLFVRVIEPAQAAAGDVPGRGAPGDRAALVADREITIDAMNGIAVLRRRGADYAAAESLLTNSLALCREHLRPDHPYTIQTLSNLAVVHARSDRPATAESLYTHVLDAYRRLGGEDHPSTWRVMSSLATLYAGNGRLEEAESLNVAVLEGRSKLLGDDHPLVLRTRHNLGVLYQRQGRLDAARETLESVVEARRRLFGDDYDKTLQSSITLAAVYRQQGRYADAERLYRRILAARRGSLDEDHRYVAYDEMRLGSFLTERGRHADALAYLEPAVRKFRALGVRKTDLGLTLEELAICLDATGDTERAEAICREAVDALVEGFGDSHEYTKRAREACERIAAAP